MVVSVLPIQLSTFTTIGTLLLFIVCVCHRVPYVISMEGDVSLLTPTPVHWHLLSVWSVRETSRVMVWKEPHRCHKRDV